ncbi:ATP-binding cassette sub-family D member 3 [Phytophthora citrophthora]|uniref:ATP-binding cassette sub-family D member 3 n=1 Tax=Phytophthora citrophthora TaxID=4793 RepID=A0AAD9GBM7_9STRA|nr:ATP-binding cassette sub-family D member 3 [Phytophthora citrophthora]
MAVLSKTSAVASASALIAIAIVIRENGRQKTTTTTRTTAKVAINQEFFRRFLRLFQVIAPGVFTAEMGFAVLVAAMLTAKTSLDISVLNLFTSIERAIVSRSKPDFQHHLGHFLAIMLPMSCINCLLKYSQSELRLRFRTRLSQHLYEKYLKGFVYYKVANIDNRVSNADQLLTVDVERFSNSVTELYVNLSKPVLDIAIYAAKLTSSVGIQAPAIMLSYLVTSGVFLTWLRQPMSRFSIAEQQAEGTFRFMNSRLITNSEEIAFYNGNIREKSILDESFHRLIDQIRSGQQFRIAVNAVDTIVAKYLAIVAGYYVVSKPFMDLSNVRLADLTYEERMEDYFRSGKMMINLAEATGRLVLCGRELTHLSGFTTRIIEMLDVLVDLDNGNFERHLLENNNGEENFQEQRGELQYCDQVIEFEDVPLMTPNGDVLIPSLTFRVTTGMNVVVVGPNGSGKSSLFRTFGELWPLYGGKLIKPQRNGLFYIPQRPYLTLGSLRDQVIYPHSPKDMQAAAVQDEDLMFLLGKVQLEHLVNREGGWDVVRDWTDVLSGGEKQRLAMARLFYHKPQFAILDECTSAVSVDVEGAMYSYCREQNITLFTVSHRKSLWKYHEHVLEVTQTCSLGRMWSLR